MSREEVIRESEVFRCLGGLWRFTWYPGIGMMWGVPAIPQPQFLHLDSCKMYTAFHCSCEMYKVVCMLSVYISYCADLEEGGKGMGRGEPPGL